MKRRCVLPGNMAVLSILALSCLLVWARQASRLQVDAPACTIHATPLVMRFSPDGRLLVTGNAYKQARVWDVATGKLWRSLEAGQGGVVGAAFSADGRQLVIVGGEGSIRVWDTLTWQSLRQIKQAFPNTFRLMQVSLEKNVLTLVDRAKMRQWDVSSGLSLLTRPLLTGGAKSDALSSNGRWAVGRGKQGDVTLTDLQTGLSVPLSVGLAGRPVRSLAWGNAYRRSNRISDAVFSSDDTLLAVGSAMGQGKMWRAADHREVAAFQACAVAFSANSKILATGANNDQIALRDVKTGRAFATIRLFQNPLSQSSVRLLQFSPSGKYLAAAINDTVQVWDVQRSNTKADTVSQP